MAKHFRKITAAMRNRDAGFVSGNGRKRPGSQNRKKSGFAKSPKN